MEPLVSVICITRNHERFCIESLDSVLNQTYKNIEWIILDAASTDGTVELIDNWLVENNVQAVFLKEKELKPITVNLNKALTYAHGEYVQFLSLDDLLLPEKIDVQVKFLTSQDIDLVYSNSMTIDSNRKYIKPYRLNEYLEKLESVSYLSEIKTNCFLLIQSCLIPHRTLEKVGLFDENLIIEDWDWFIRFWKLEPPLVAKFDGTINTLYRTIEGSLWYGRSFELFKSHFNIIKKHNLGTDKRILINHLQLFVYHKISYYKMLKYFLFEFGMISMLILFVTNNLSLFRIIHKIEIKFRHYEKKYLRFYRSFRE